MKPEQINVVNKLASENVITLNGLEAHAYPCEDGILIDNNPLQDTDDEWDELIVDYSMFIDVMRNNDGRFDNRRVAGRRST